MLEKSRKVRTVVGGTSGENRSIGRRRSKLSAHHLSNSDSLSETLRQKDRGVESNKP